MTKAEFKRSMKCGLGRCVLELKKSEDKEKYRDIILWGCLHNLSLDAQCEGTRVRYMYSLLRLVQDDDYFLLPVANAFEKYLSNNYWLFSHFCELIFCFAEDGNELARKVLYSKYDELYQKLIKKQKRQNPIDYDKEKYEVLCIRIISIDGELAFLKIAKDMGALFIRNDEYDGSDFDWFYSIAQDQIGKKKVVSLIKKETAEIEMFYNTFKAYKNLVIHETVTIVPTAEEIYKTVLEKETIVVRDKLRFSRRASEEEKVKLAKMVLVVENLSYKAELLSVFRFRGFPLECEKLIDYTNCENEKLSKVAYEVLENCKGECVHRFALELFACNNHMINAICMLITNYREEDKTTVLPILNKLPVNYSDFRWHHITLHITDSREYPKDLYMYVYRNSLCSCCRERAVSMMAKHKWLTDDIIQECAYDSNEGIRNYIMRYYKGRKRL